MNVLHPIHTNPRLARPLFAAGCIAVLTLAACGGSPTAPTAAAVSSSIPVVQPTTVAQNATLAPTAQNADNTRNPVQTFPPMSPEIIIPTSAAPALAPGILPTDSAGLQLVATVNGEGIRLAEYERALVRFQQQQIEVADAATLRAAVLNTLIEQRLIAQEAGRQGVTLTDVALDEEIAANAALAGSPDAWQNWLAGNGYSEGEFRQSLRDTLLTNQMRDRLTLDLEGNIPQVHARHILVSTQVQAVDILARLRAGEDFAALAAANSNDITSRDNGGDLGWFAQDELLEPVLADIAFSSELNTFSEPVPTALGFHIIEVLERADRPIAEEQRPELAQRRFENWLNTLTAQAVIEIYL